MNCIIIHGSNIHDQEKLARGESPQNKRHWIPWLKRELEMRGIKTDTPLMPKNWNLIILNGKKNLKNLILMMRVF